MLSLVIIFNFPVGVNGIFLGWNIFIHCIKNWSNGPMKRRKTTRKSDAFPWDSALLIGSRLMAIIYLCQKKKKKSDNEIILSSNFLKWSKDMEWKHFGDSLEWILFNKISHKSFIILCKLQIMLTCAKCKYFIRKWSA